MQQSRTSRVRELQPADTVLVKNFGSGPTWLYGEVVRVLASSVYEVRLSDGRVVRRHNDQTRRCIAKPVQQSVPAHSSETVDKPLEYTPEALTQPSNLPEPLPVELTQPPETTEVVVPNNSEPKELSSPGKVEPHTEPAQPTRVSEGRKNLLRKFADYIMTKP